LNRSGTKVAENTSKSSIFLFGMILFFISYVGQKKRSV